MCNWLYTLRQRFTPASSDSWQSYLSYSGFTHIQELVTLDSIMCANVITDLVDQDWDFNVHDDCRTELFHDADYLLSRQPLDRSLHQILAVLEFPSGNKTVPDGFTECGFDIMDSYFGNSTLTNCGPIPDAFDASTVNKWGLLDDRETALEVRDTMRQLNPDDPHLGACEVWFVARKLPDE